jgi:hypothetical protein
MTYLFSKDIDLSQAMESGDYFVSHIVPMAMKSLEDPTSLLGIFQMSRDK